MAAALSQIEKQLLMFGVGGYSVWSLGYGLVFGGKKAHAEEHHAPEPVKAAPAPVAAPAPAKASVAAPKTAAPGELKLDGPNDPMVLFALQDIQSRLSVIEKALKLE